jgi:sulfide:quinone oxidoreductase
MTDPPTSALRVLVLGGGPAALEGALRLQRLAGHRVRITLAAPEPTFRYRPLAVAEPFDLAPVPSYRLARLAAERGFDFVLDAAVAVDLEARVVDTRGGASLPYDALLVAVGAGTASALPGALTFAGTRAGAALRAELHALGSGRRRIAFVAAGATAWTLPLYELACRTAAWAAESGRDVETWLVTHERRALGVFGDAVAVKAVELLEASGVRLWTGALADCVEDGRLWLDMEGGLPVDLAVALPRPVARAIAGLPGDADGFLPADAYGRLKSAPAVYAAGDATSRPLRQGGLATQQADAAAASIALQAGAPGEPDPYHPVLRGLLLTGGRPWFLSRAPGAAGEAVADAAWWPPHKIAGRELAPYLDAHPELQERDEVLA